MSLYYTMTIALCVFLTGIILYLLIGYFGFRYAKPKSQPDLRSKIQRRTRRKGKYILNHFTARIFFSELERKRRLRVVNGNTPLTTEKYSFTQTKRFDN